MLEIKDLSVEVAGKKIIRNINLNIDDSETMVLFGPNGSGKTTLIKAIMGFEGYHIKSGKIVFNGKDMNDSPIEQRVRERIGIMYQHPPKIRGVKLAQIANFLTSDKAKITRLAEKLSLREHLNRDVNLGFSGGEMKRSELLQVLLQEPRLLLLDEPESGVDLENISLMGEVLNDYLKQKDKSALIITHTGYILDYVKVKKGCVMIDGRFWCTGGPKEMFETIKKKGYEKCTECHDAKRVD